MHSDLAARHLGRRLVLAGLAVAALTSSAVADESDPAAFIRAFAQRTDQILQPTGGTAASAADRFRSLLREEVDLTEALHLVLGNDWEQTAPAQRTATRQAFEDYLVRLLGERARGFNGRYPEIGETRLLPDHQAIVVTTMGVAAVPVYWRLKAEAPPPAHTDAVGAWRIVDVTFAGIDAVSFFRDQFARSVRDGGIAKLTADLAAKAAQ